MTTNDHAAPAGEHVTEQHALAVAIRLARQADRNGVASRLEAMLAASPAPAETPETDAGEETHPCLACGGLGACCPECGGIGVLYGADRHPLFAAPAETPETDAGDDQSCPKCHGATIYGIQSATGLGQRACLMCDWESVAAPQSEANLRATLVAVADHCSREGNVTWSATLRFLATRAALSPRPTNPPTPE